MIGEARDEDRDSALVAAIAWELRGAVLPGARPWSVYASGTTAEMVSFAQADARVDDLDTPAVRLMAMDVLGLESGGGDRPTPSAASDEFGGRRAVGQSDQRAARLSVTASKGSARTADSSPKVSTSEYRSPASR